MSQSYPIQIVSTGLKDIIIPITTLDKLFKITPNNDKISQLSKKYDVVGYHLFTMDTLDKTNSTAHARNLAPLYGVDEESATGTASCALACYLYRHKLIKGSEEIIGDDKSDMKPKHIEKVEVGSGGSRIYQMQFEQGYCMKTPSQIFIELEGKGDEIMSIKVGGYGAGIKEHAITMKE